MVYYHFDKVENQDYPEPKSKVRVVSKCKLFRELMVIILQGINIFYVQYQIFYRLSESSFQYYSKLAIYLLAGIIAIIFNARIFILNKDKHTKTIFISVGVFVFINFLFTNSSSDTLLYQLLRHFVSSVFLCFQLPNFMRHVFVMKYAIKCNYLENEKNTRYYEEMVKAEADAGLISFLDCYLRGVPLEIVQIMAVLSANGDLTQLSVFDQLSICCALIMLPWTATTYHESLRKQQDDIFPWTTILVYFTWNVFILGARIISISAGMTFWFTFIIIAFHWIFASLYLYYSHKPMDFYNCNKYLHVLFCSIFGAIFIFAPVNFNNRRKFQQYTYFYLIVFEENCIFLLFWAVNEISKNLVDKLIFCGVITIMFVIGILINLCYYLYLHPKFQRTDIRVSADETNKLSENTSQ